MVTQARSRLAQGEHVPPSNAPERHYELDWLRVAVVLGLIPYHVAVIFTVGPGDYIKSADRSSAFDLVATLVAFLGMPLLFLISGAATWYAMQRRGPSRYVLERARRLAVPLLFGVFTVMPVQLFIYRHTQPNYHSSFLAFYGQYISDWAHITWHLAFGRGLQFWGHLWFLLYLLAVSVLLLPLLVWLKRHQESVSRLASLAASPLGLIALGAPLGLTEVVLRGPIGSSPALDYNNLYSAAAGLVLYAVAFVVGFMLGPDATFRRAVIRYRKGMLAFGVLLIVAHEIVVAALGAQPASEPVVLAAVRLLRGLITWSLIVSALGFATYYFSSGTRRIRYLNEACVPVYVLHMPILTALGFFVVQLNAPLLAKYLLLVILTAGLTFALYEGLVRRIPALRVAFGLKPTQPPSDHPLEEIQMAHEIERA